MLGIAILSTGLYHTLECSPSFKEMSVMIIVLRYGYLQGECNVDEQIARASRHETDGRYVICILDMFMVVFRSYEDYLGGRE